MNKLCIIFGLIGSVCFLVGDILLGAVDSTPLENRSHFYLTKGHGRTYDRKRIKTTMILAAVGIPFLYMGMVHIGDIAADSLWKSILSVLFALTSIAWFIIHINVALNVFVYSWADENVSGDSAIKLSEETNKTFFHMLIPAYFVLAASFIAVIVSIVLGKTELPKYYVMFSPLVGAIVPACIEKLLPQSKLRKIMGTIQLNFGMIVWFVSLIFV